MGTKQLALRVADLSYDSQMSFCILNLHWLTVATVDVDVATVAIVDVAVASATTI